MHTLEYTLPLEYTLRSDNRHSHVVIVGLKFTPHTSRSWLRLPAWIPGSYMIRDFSKHVISLKLDNPAYQVKKINTDTWQIELKSFESQPIEKLEPVIIEYEVYAFDRSVRGSHVDDTHLFLNLANLCLSVIGQEDVQHHIDLTPLQAKNYTVSTGLTPRQIDAAGFGYYEAASYDALIDHPIEIGQVETLFFEINKIPHKIVISGVHEGDSEQLKHDVRQICQWQCDFFSQDHSPPPFTQYVFLLTLVSSGYGGLEHRNSSALLASRLMMPEKNNKTNQENNQDKAYIHLLSLFSHEYFHAWHIKAIKPTVFYPYDLTQSQMTTQLWIFEGFTAYYDDLVLLRSGLINLDSFLLIMSENLTKLNKPGYEKQNLIESSLDAWIKFYKPDENSMNSGISYYTKGMLVALCLDLILRRLSAHQASLDQVMHFLWQTYGVTHQGLPEGEMELILIKFANHAPEMIDFLDQALLTTQELPLIPLLDFVGLKITRQADPQYRLGMVLEATGSGVKINAVLMNSPAMIAGLFAKDVIIALDQVKLTDPLVLEKKLAVCDTNQPLVFSVFREDRLIKVCVSASEPPKTQIKITVNAEATAAQIQNRLQWLGQH